MRKTAVSVCPVEKTLPVTVARVFPARVIRSQNAQITAIVSVCRRMKVLPVIITTVLLAVKERQNAQITAIVLA